MSRYPLPLGTWGTIRAERATAKTWRARTNFRDMDGKLRQVEARGPSAAAARRNLQIRLQKRLTPRHSLVASTDKISKLADLYLLELDRSDKAAGPRTNIHSVSKSTYRQVWGPSGSAKRLPGSSTTSFVTSPTLPDRPRPGPAGPCSQACSRSPAGTTPLRSTPSSG